MGLFNRKSKKKSEDNIPSNDIKLKYSSGIETDVAFGDVIDYEGKHLQEVNVTYTENGMFNGSKMYMEPHIGQDKDGVAIYDTKKYFKALSKSNRGLVKGFFEKNSINALAKDTKTNYIGTIGSDKNGRPNRNMDYKFVEKYRQDLELQQQQEAKIKENKTDEFKASLSQGVNFGYQNMCDNADKYNKQRLDHEINVR